jgi:hypothetical protein
MAQERDLVADGQDFGVLVLVGLGWQPQYRQCVGHTELGQSK